MKRFLGLFLVMAILVCNFVPVFADDAADEQADLVPIQSTSEPPCYEVVTVPAPTVSVEGGVVPYGQLVTIENNSGIGTLMYSYGYGRWFVADSPLKLIIGDELSISVKVNVDSPEPNKEYICEEATYTYTVDFSTEAVPNEYEEKYNVSYYNGGIGNEYANDTVPPYGNKISSVEELSSLWIRRPEYLAEMKEKYDKEFFKENFLVVVSWEQSHGARDRYLEKVEINEDDVNIVMGEAIYCGTSTDAFESFCAVLEMPISEDNKALELDGKFFFVPPSCIDLEVEKNEDGSVTANVTAGYANAIPPDGKVILAAYTDDGALHSVQTVDNNDWHTFIFEAVPDNVNTFKAMWWDSMSDMKPVIAAEKRILE